MPQQCHTCMHRHTDRHSKCSTKFLCIKLIVSAGVPGAAGPIINRTQTALSPLQWTELIHRTPMCTLAMFLQMCQMWTSGSILATLVALQTSRSTGKVRALFQVLLTHLQDALSESAQGSCRCVSFAAEHQLLSFTASDMPAVTIQHCASNLCLSAVYVYLQLFRSDYLLRFCSAQTS